MKVSWLIGYLPMFFLSYYSFFTNHRSEAFVLNIPMSYVSNILFSFLLLVKFSKSFIRFTHSSYCRSPFNSKTPFGYFVAFSIEFMTCYPIFMNCTCILSFLSGVCWILTSFVGDIEYDVHNLKKMENNRMASTQTFFNIIKFHSNIKQLSIGQMGAMRNGFFASWF